MSLKLHEVLQSHHSEKVLNSHSDILGDSFLLKYNALYRSIKHQAVSIGCTYKEASIEYVLMPFQQLGKIAETKTIPYIPNARLIQDVEDRRHGVLTIDDIHIPESYHMHEAAHLVAENFLNTNTFSNPQEKILKSMVCESFANTVDALSWISVKEDMHHFFLWQNCYMHPSSEETNAISQIVKSFGMHFTALFTLISYLHVNFLKEEVPVPLIEDLVLRSAPDVKLNKDRLAECEAVQRVTNLIDPQFRMVTTKTYLNLEGFDGEVDDILNFDFMKVFGANPIFQKSVDEMVDLISKPI